MENDTNGRQTQWEIISMKEGLNGRQPQLKTTSIEDDFNVEEYLNGSLPQWKPNRKQVTLACLDCLARQSITEPGPAQPQLVYINYQILSFNK